MTGDKMNIIDCTKSMCPECLEIIDARVIEKQGILYLNKTCKRHGMFEVRHVFDTHKVYAGMNRIFSHIEGACDFYPRDLILYITFKCNQKCPICYMRVNEEKARRKDPSIEEILDRVKDYHGEYILLSGGEPTLREDLFEIISRLKKKGFKVCLMTNGKKLKNMDYVRKLKAAGLDLVDLQFDSLDDDDQEAMRGDRLTGIKKKAVDNLNKAGIWIFLFSVIVDNVNTDQIGRLVRFSLENIRSVKILNFTPIWQLGRYSEFGRISNSRILEELESQTSLSVDDFIVCTEFALLLFEVQRKLIGKMWTRQPGCALRCYVFKFNEGDIKPLNKIVDLERINRHLKLIISSLKDKGKAKNWLRLTFTLPYFFLMRELIFNIQLWKFYKKIIADIFNMLWKRRSLKEVFKPVNILSIMVGVFHNKYNIDLDIVKRCTLYSDLLDDKGMASACIRHIYDDDVDR